jgi:hypothetical protein
VRLAVVDGDELGVGDLAGDEVGGDDGDLSSTVRVVGVAGLVA